MAATISSTRSRIPAVLSVIGVVLLAGGVAVAVIIRVVTIARVTSGPMPVLPEQAYTGYTVAPAVPLTDPYALGNALVFVAFGVAAIGLLALVLGVALHATARRSH